MRRRPRMTQHAWAPAPPQHSTREPAAHAACMGMARTLTMVAPVMIAMSSRYDVLRSPKPGALTAMTLRLPRSLFTTSVASGSCSKSSAMMRSG